jgi:polar amino acid transport system substrate-binding protein
VLVCTLALAPGGPAAAAPEVVRVGSTLDLVPFTFVDVDGRPTGFELDLLALIGARLELRFEYVKTPVTQAFTGLAAGKYRLNASAIAIRCERLAGAGKVGRFTVPTFSQGYVIAAPASHRERTASFEALRGLRVGVESRGSTGDTLTEAHRARVGFAKTVFDSSATQFLALRQGRVDAAVQGELVSRHLTRERADVVVGASLPGTVIPVGFVFREGDPLRLRFNDAIDALKRADAIARLYERWFGSRPGPGNAALDVVPEVTIENCRSAS